LFIHSPTHLPLALRYYNSFFTKRFVKKATSIVTFSNYLLTSLIEKYPLAANKAKAIYIAIPDLFIPVDREQKQNIKDSFADGREYFLFMGGNHPIKNLVGLLKAFSLFKRWQKSNMKLIVTGLITEQKDDVLQKLSS
jgi:glycosyltransferase involved in cell wall biosynthesis